MARVVALADEFCNYAVKHEHNLGLSAPKVLALMNEFMGEVLDGVSFKALTNPVKKG